MAYEFKKLSAVEAVETVSDTASVLIEENGVIKRAPKSEVGGAGGGGETPDMTLVINTSGMLSSATVSDMSTEGDVMSVLTKLQNGENATVWIKTIFAYGSTTYAGLVKNPAITAKGTSVLKVDWRETDGYTSYAYYVDINSDGSVNYFYKFNN